MKSVHSNKNVAGLFLLGLVIYLNDLSPVVSVAVLLISVLTLAFYVITTLLPLVVPFCPYNTPLSSPRLWGFCYRRCLQIWRYASNFFFTSGSTISNSRWPRFLVPCRQAEIKISTRTQPDHYTGNALKWLIMHSHDPKAREMAIQAIAGVDSEDTIRPLLKEQHIVPQVAQSFTVCFAEFPGDGIKSDRELRQIRNIKIASLHGQALTKLTSYPVAQDTLFQSTPLKQSFDVETLKAVERRYHL
jgi:hypothetical protein